MSINRTYIPSEKVKQYIEDGDMRALRETMGTIIYTDRAFLHGEFEAAIRYITGDCFITELFEKFNPDPPLKSKTGQETFAEEDFTAAVFALKNNFCRERIEDVKVIGKAVYERVQKKAENVTKQQAEEAAVAAAKQNQNPIAKFFSGLIKK